MIDGTEKTQIPSKFAKHAARYNEFDSKSNGFFNQITSVKMLATILIDLYLNYNNYDHRNESYRAVLSCATVYYAVHAGSNFWVCGWNP